MKVEIDIPEYMLPLLTSLQGDLWNNRLVHGEGSRDILPNYAEVILELLERERQQFEHQNREYVIASLLKPDNTYDKDDQIPF